MNVLVLTSNSYRHNYFAYRICENFNVIGVFCEEKAFNPNQNYKNEKEKILLKKWVDFREKEEKKTFGKYKKLIKKYDDKCFNLNKKEINSEIVKDIARNSDIAVVFGTSIIKDDLLNIVPMINMHLGLSPYYRGSGTNFWPFYNNEPEYCGVTIHKLSTIVDGGEIIHQGIPKIEENDNPHSIGNKIIKIGTELMIKTLKEFENRELKSYVQTIEYGKQYYRKDFNADKAKYVMDNYKEIIKDSIQRKKKINIIK